MLRKCLDCGSDCAKKETAPVPREQPQKEPTNNSLASTSVLVNPGIVELTDLVFPGKVMDKDIVAAIREVHHKYDKTLHSKCKRGAEYGIQLRRSAIDAVTQKFGAVAHTAPKPRKPDKRTLPCRISCRLSESEYSELQLSIREDGYGTMQDWLLRYVRQYIKRKRNARNKKMEEPR